MPERMLCRNPFLNNIHSLYAIYEPPNIDCNPTPTGDVMMDSKTSEYDEGATFGRKMSAAMAMASTTMVRKKSSNSSLLDCSPNTMNL